MHSLTACLSVLCVCITPLMAQRVASSERLLLTYLFDSNYYSPYMRPNLNNSDIIEVELELELVTILSVHEITSEITLIVWYGISWVDKNLIWDPAEWSDIDHLHVPSFWLWLPDIVAKETVSTTSPTNLVTYYTLHSDGSVRGYYPQILTLHCRFSTSHFPFDSQTCVFRFGSFAYPLHILTLEGEAHDENLKANSEWQVDSWEAENEIADYEGIEFSEVHYKIRFSRNSDFYVITLIIPSSLITTLSVLGTFSPFATGLLRQERVYVGITIFLTMSVLLMVVAEETPKSDSGYPFIGEFFFIQMMLIVTHSICAVIIMYINTLGAFGVAYPRRLRFMICDFKDNNDESDEDTVSTVTIYDNGSEQQLFRKWSDKQRVNYNEANRNLQSLVAQVHQLRREVTHALNDGCQEAWNRLCFVLDVIFMVIFMIIQIIITIVYSTAPNPEDAAAVIEAAAAGGEADGDGDHH